MFPEKGDREKALNSLSGFNCRQPSYNCLALLRPQACGAPSLMARCATPDVGHPIFLLFTKLLSFQSHFHEFLQWKRFIHWMSMLSMSTMINMSFCQFWIIDDLCYFSDNHEDDSQDSLNFDFDFENWIWIWIWIWFVFVIWILWFSCEILGFPRKDVKNIIVLLNVWIWSLLAERNMPMSSEHLKPSSTPGQGYFSPDSFFSLFLLPFRFLTFFTLSGFHSVSSLYSKSFSCWFLSLIDSDNNHHDSQMIW
jgi:hypothetical protein